MEDVYMTIMQDFPDIKTKLENILQEESDDNES
jgi:hypothetical protein